MRKINEECGVFGIYSPETQDVAHVAYYGLFALQHRGQESCGIVVNDDGVFSSHKDAGIVNDVFTPDTLERLGQGNMALGHVRYGTTGATGRRNAQPIVINHNKGTMAIAHNGNLVNSSELREELELQGSIFHTTSDTEVISYIITKERLSAPSIEEAVNRTMNRIRGAYSLVVMSPSKMIAARDENGFHPLCYGKRVDGSYVIASESCALDAVGANFLRDIEPGEVLVIDSAGMHSHRIAGRCKPAACIFEYVYFSRPDSILDGCSVYETRMAAGRILAENYPVEADIVSGVPDSAIVAARGYSQVSGIPYVEALEKNRYVGRTFIQPDQKMREDSVSVKMNPLRANIQGKRLVLIDDSIVRGTTSRRIVRMLKEAGAKEVHLRICSPVIRHPCHLGIDMQSYSQLIGANKTEREICEYIGADSLKYLTIDQLTESCKAAKIGFCLGCFDGKYPYSPEGEESGKFKFE